MPLCKTETQEEKGVRRKGTDDEVHFGCAEFEVTETHLDRAIQDSAGNTDIRRGWNGREDSELWV